MVVSSGFRMLRIEGRSTITSRVILGKLLSISMPTRPELESRNSRGTHIGFVGRIKYSKYQLLSSVDISAFCLLNGLHRLFCSIYMKREI